VKVLPDPNKGNFAIQMQLPSKEAKTMLTLYNSLNVKVWQQDMGIISGNVTKDVYLENKLSTGLYVLLIQRSDVRYTTKLFIGR